MKKQWKYEAGELVELSAAGKKSQQNGGVLGKIGMITKIEGTKGNTHRSDYPYQIHWIGFQPHDGILPMKEYEIKRVRAAVS